MNLAQQYVYPLLVNLGYLQHQWTGSTNKYAYKAFRKQYGLTRGASNDRLSEKIRRHIEKHTFPDKTEGVTGRMDAARLKQVVSQIQQHGYYVFDQRLPEAACDQLRAFALDTPAQTVPPASGNPILRFDPENPVAPMYKIFDHQLLENRQLRDLLLDLNFLRIAQEYLDSCPLNDIFLMWWSSPTFREASSAAAQLYHYDMDHPKFLKFFIYLTDVDAKGGPHCYVRGSHRKKPDELLHDGRFSDESVERHYPAKDILELTGPRGTIIAADTSGIHKGKLPEGRERLLFQLEFTNSFFGQKVKHHHALDRFDEDQQAFLNQYKSSFTRFF